MHFILQKKIPLHLLLINTFKIICSSGRVGFEPTAKHPITFAIRHHHTIFLHLDPPRLAPVHLNKNFFISFIFLNWLNKLTMLAHPKKY